MTVPTRDINIFCRWQGLKCVENSDVIFGCLIPKYGVKLDPGIINNRVNAIVIDRVTLKCSCERGDTRRDSGGQLAM